MTTSRLEVLGEEECLRLLGTQALGRLVFVHEFDPVVLPVNYALDGRDVVFRTDLGIKTRAATYGFRAAFEVDDLDVVARAGWDVVVQGTLEDVAERHGPAEADRLRALGVDPWAPGEKARLLRLVSQRITGRRLAGTPTGGG